MSNEGRLTAAGWQRLHQPCDLTMYRWTQDGIDWFTEDEALVVVLTTERDAAIARAERAEAELGECKRWIGDVMEAMDNEFMSIQMAPVFIGAMAEMQKEYVPEMQALRARAERAEAQRDSARRDANGAAHRGDMACARADAAEAQRDALQRHFDAAGPEHNLLALLDHYMELADAAEALAASRLDVSPELACGWLSERLGGPATSAVFAALRAHAAKVIR